MKRKNNLQTVFFLFIVFIFLLLVLPVSLSRYQSTGVSNVNSSVAYYVLNTSYQYLDVKIPDIVPRSTPYVYNFTISNHKDNKRAEVNLEYDLLIKATTNLELRYELYLNEDYTNGTAQNIIISDEVVQDDHNTYFKELKTPKKYFTHLYDETNNYTLLIYFDEAYKHYKYQDNFESIFIIIDSKQTTA